MLPILINLGMDPAHTDRNKASTANKPVKTEESITREAISAFDILFQSHLSRVFY